MAATDRNIRVFSNGVRQADVKIPHTAAQLPTTSWTQSLDSLFLFHEDVQPHLVRRLGDDDSWRDSVQAFTNIPTKDFNDTLGTGAEAVWSAVRGWPRAGIFFKGRLYLGGTRDLSQTYWFSKAAGDLFDFDFGTGAADDGFELTMDTDEAAAIYGFVSADFLFIITRVAHIVAGNAFHAITGENPGI